MPLDSSRIPPYFLAPKSSWPEVVVDEYRYLIIDPTDQSILGFDASPTYRMGRLVQTSRSSANRY